jgi:hypothetical protein
MANNPFRTFWERLTPRERTMVLSLVLVFFVMGTIVLLFLRGNSLRQTRSEITEIRRALDQVYTRGAVYQERLAAKRARESKISSNRVLFATLLEEAQAGVENVTVSNEEELPIVELGDGLVKRTFKFDLRSVTLEDLTKFLSSIEGKRGHIILTEQLLIRSPSANENRLNVDVTLATWERRGVAEEEDDDEDEDGRR